MRLTVRPGSHLAAAALVALMLAACGAGSPSPSPSPTTPSMVDGGSPSPAAATTRAPTPRPTATPAGDWPNGWDTAFCDAFEQVAISQELAVDVGRALDEDARDDALALARELEATGATAAELLGELVQWEPAQEAVA